MKLSQKIVLTVLLVVNLGLMFGTWFGAAPDVQDISGIIVLFNPLNIISALLIVFGLWVKKAKKIIFPCVYCGFVGIITAEIYEFFTWYLETITSKFSVLNSFYFARPLFYVGLMLTVASLTTSVLFGYCEYRREENKTLCSE